MSNQINRSFVYESLSFYSSGWGVGVKDFVWPLFNSKKPSSKNRKSDGLWITLNKKHHIKKKGNSSGISISFTFIHLNVFHNQPLYRFQGKRTNLSKSKLRKAWASLSQSVELVTALAIGHPSTNHLKKWVDSPARCLITCSILSWKRCSSALVSSVEWQAKSVSLYRYRVGG